MKDTRLEKLVIMGKWGDDGVANRISAVEKFTGWSFRLVKGDHGDSRFWHLEILDRGQYGSDSKANVVTLLRRGQNWVAHQYIYESPSETALKFAEDVAHQAECAVDAAEHSLGETATSLRMKLELRGETA